MGVVGSAHRIDIPLESKGRIARYGRWEIIEVLLKILVLGLSDRRSHRFTKDRIGALSKDVLDVVGYGVHAGRKG